MINDAIQIIGGVPGQNLNPLLLAKSQAKETTGFIMVAYDISTEEVLQEGETMPPGRKFYDLLFFKGATIYECARLNQDLRFTVNGDTALQTFERRRRNPSTSVFLFQAPEELILRFRSTFYYEPCLKVQIESLSKKQIATLLRTSRCRHGILECNEFTSKSPAIHLTEIRSEEELVGFTPTLKHGRLLLYDIEKNREIIRERYSRSSDDINTTINTNDGRSPNAAQLITPSFRMGNCEVETPALSKVEADEFTEFIQRILKSPMSQDESGSAVQGKEPVEDPKKPRPGIVVRVQESVPLGQEDVHPATEKEVQTNLDATAENESKGGRSQINIRHEKISQKGRNNRRTERQIKAASRQRRELTSDSKEAEKAADVQQNHQSQSEYVRTFERLLRSFRQQVFEYFGDRCEDVIARAEKKVRFLTPEFNCHALTDDTASSTLEVVEEIIKEAPFMKRSKLRQAAITLISDLYNKQYNLLEQHNAIDRVEQVYYRLKK